MKQEYDIWAPRVREIAAEHPDWTDQQVTWQVIEEMAIRGWKMLEPIYQQHRGQKGRLSIQIDPTLNRSAGADARAGAPLRHAGAQRADQVPGHRGRPGGHRAGHLRGHEHQRHRLLHGRRRRWPWERPSSAPWRGARPRGIDTSWMSPTCTIMIGRTDDWVKKSCERDGITIDPAAADWAGIAVFKRAAAIFEERGYRARLLAAAYRHHLHWSELIGGDISMTIPANWQRLFNASAVEVKDRWHDPVPAVYVDELVARVPEFVKAYEPDGPEHRAVRHLRRHDAHAARLHRLVLGARGHHRRPAHPQPGREGA